MRHSGLATRHDSSSASVQAHVAEQPDGAHGVRHNAPQMDIVGALREHPGLVQLTLHQQTPAAPKFRDQLPRRLTSLRLHEGGKPVCPAPGVRPAGRCAS